VLEEAPMTPFQVFRRWFRRAPVFQKVTAVGAAALALSALMWAVVPGGAPTNGFGLGLNGPVGGSVAGAGSATTTSSTTATTIAAPVASAGAAGGGAGAAGAAGGAHPAGVAASSPSAAAGASHPACQSPPGSAPGVSATQVNIAVLLVDIAGPAANSTFGIPPPAVQQAGFQAVINNVNASGGVACRKLVPQYYTENPVDQSGLQQACLTITQSNVFAVVDPGAYANYAAGLDCYAQNHMPYIMGYQLDGTQIAHDYPFLFAIGNLTVTYRDSVFALAKLGFFSPTNGFKKLGLIYRDCYPDLVSGELSWLSQFGVTSADVSSYDMGCPQAFANPSDIENAILQFKAAGVTNMTEVSELGDMANFTTVAQQQGFDPKWGIGDDALFEINSGSEAPNPQNMNGAIGIAANRDGENNTPSLASNPTAGTAKCNAILQTAGQSVYGAAAVGNACDQIWMLQAALDNAPQLSQAALAAGLQKTGSIDFSFPQGPSNFTATGTTYGGQFWRQDQYTTACNCWQVVNPNWSPSY
jgi:hypothetical protein